MHSLINRFCRQTPPCPPQPALVQPAPLQPGLALAARPLVVGRLAARGNDVAAADAAAGAAADAAADAASAQRAEAGVCGWFDSSLDLRCGLAVSEVSEPDWTVLALWFGPAAVRAAGRLQ